MCSKVCNYNDQAFMKLKIRRSKNFRKRNPEYPHYTREMDSYEA